MKYPQILLKYQESTSGPCLRVEQMSKPFQALLTSTRDLSMISLQQSALCLTSQSLKGLGPRIPKNKIPLKHSSLQLPLPQSLYHPETQNPSAQKLIALTSPQKPFSCSNYQKMRNGIQSCSIASPCHQQRETTRSMIRRYWPSFVHQRNRGIFQKEKNTQQRYGQTIMTW